MSMSENKKRQPAGIPVGGQFAANEHDEAGASLSVGQMDKTNEGSALSNAYPIDFPISGETFEKVDWAKDNDAILIVDMDIGIVPLGDNDLGQGWLHEEWENLAPGEAFEVIGAYRRDVEKDKNPYGASDKAIAAANEIGSLLRSGDPRQEAADMIANMSSTPERKSEYYAAMSSYAELTPEADARLSALMDKHDVTRVDVDLYISGEFGMAIPYTAPNGSEAHFAEHPNRIINRIDNDYLEEVVRFASRDKHDY